MKKSIVVLFTILTLFCAMTSTAFADGDAVTAKIIITNTITETGIDLTGKEFSVYKIFDATINNDETSSSINYTLDSTFTNFFTSIDSMQNLSGTALEDAAENYINALTSSSERQDFVTDLEDYVTDEGIEPVATISGSITTTSSIQSMASDDLAPGYYLILDTSTNDSTISAGMLISLPVTDTKGEFTENGTITMKGSQPEIEKEIWHNDSHSSGAWDSVGDYEIGDTVTFRITAGIPSDIRGYEDYTYIITDTWTDGISFDTASVKFYTDSDLESEVTGTLHEQTVDADNNSLTLVIDMSAIKATNSQLENLYITYTGTITEDVEMALNCETNTVELKYSNNPYDSTSFGYDEDMVYSYTFQLDVFKTDTTQVNALEDATFELWVDPSGENEVDYQVYLEKDDDDSTIYYVQQTGTPSEDTGNIVTGDSGKFTIKGLDDAITYILKEVEAPDGYTAADDISFQISADYTNVTNPVITSTNSVISVESGVLSTTVINTSSKLFPGTGGIGTTIFMVCGVALMIVAGFLLIFNRKKTA